MCCFSELFVSSDFFITDKTYKCFLVMNFLFALFHTAFKIEFIICGRFHYEAQDFFKLFLVLRSYISCNSWQTHQPLFFVDGYLLDISLFMSTICALSSPVFLSFLLIHYGCLFCFNKFMKFTYDVIFYVAFGTFRCISLFTGVHCVICVFKNEKTILSVISMFLTYVLSNYFSSPPISRSSAFSTICH